MKTRFLALFLILALLALPGLAAAREVVLPAGTLLNCVMDEPNFSSATASIGDPFLCHPRSIQMFGQSVFPRGAYLVGHLEEDKDPGHFVGKGFLKLSFDRIGLANTDLPLPAKVIAVKGYKVDREGRIIGHGHATRDTVEWLLPPLWPWKVLTLPARGPRPALKGETRVTLRLMDDVTVPLPDGIPSRSNFGDPRGALRAPSFREPSTVPNAPRPYSEPATPAREQPAAPAAQNVVTQAVSATDNPVAVAAPAVQELPVAAVSARPAVRREPAADNGWRHFGPPKSTESVNAEQH